MNPIVVFDLDGTLADTAPDLMATLNTLLAQEGLPTLPMERAKSLIGAGARALIARGYETAGLELTPERHELLFQQFLTLYRQNICNETRLFPGVVAAMDSLGASGFTLAVCTNKVEGHSRLLLEALGITGYFAAICGRDTFPFCKPDPRHLTETIAMARGDAGRAVMIGDSHTDIATAQAARIPVIAVPFGYTDQPVETYGPDRVITHFDALPQAVEDVLARA
jgi:phosphoglycolate phosphatase